MHRRRKSDAVRSHHQHLELEVARRVIEAAQNRNDPGSKQLFQATLSLRLDQPYALALTNDEASASALMVVLTPSPSRSSGAN